MPEGIAAGFLLSSRCFRPGTAFGVGTVSRDLLFRCQCVAPLLTPKSSRPRASIAILSFNAQFQLAYSALFGRSLLRAVGLVKLIAPRLGPTIKPFPDVALRVGAVVVHPIKHY